MNALQRVRTLLARPSAPAAPAQVLSPGALDALFGGKPAQPVAALPYWWPDDDPAPAAPPPPGPASQP